MDFIGAKNKLNEYNQGHVLKYYDELSEAQRSSLIKQIDDTDFEIIKHSRENRHAEAKGVISPISVMTVGEIEKELALFEEKGIEATVLRLLTVEPLPVEQIVNSLSPNHRIVILEESCGCGPCRGG